MLPLIIPIGALLAGVSLLLLGSGLLNTLLALRGGLEAYADNTMGFIMSGYFIGFIVGTFIALPLIHRIGHIRSFAFCAAVVSCSVLLHELFVNPYVWMALRIMTGSMLVILYTVIESWLSSQTPSLQRGRVFAVYMIVNLVSLTIAQQLLRLDSPAAFTLFAISAMLISISLVPVTWTRLSQPIVNDITRLSFRSLYKTAPVAVAGGALSGLSMGAFWGMAAVYAGRVGFDSHNVANFMSCAILGGAALQYPLGRYSDSHDRRKVLALVAVCAGLAALLLVFIPQGDKRLMLAIAVYGGLAFAVYPLAIAHLNDHLETKNILAGCSALLLMHAIGAAVGPAIAGQLMALIDHNALPLYFAIIQFSLALFTLWKIRQQQKDSPTDSAVHFVPMVRTTPTALEMLPEDEEIVVEPEQR